MNGELILDIISDLLRRRVRVAENSSDYAMLTDTIAFVKTWGTPESAFIRRLPHGAGPQFMSFTINGQPVNVQEMMNGQAQNFGNHTGV